MVFHCFQPYEFIIHLRPQNQNRTNFKNTMRELKLEVLKIILICLHFQQPTTITSSSSKTYAWIT